MPVEMLVIIIVAIIVLLALVALFLGGYTGVQVIDSGVAKAKACAVIVNKECVIGAYDSPVYGTEKFCNRESPPCSVSEICTRIGLLRDDCYKSCGCLTGPKI